jgi:hypothetical protein
MFGPRNWAWDLIFTGIPGMAEVQAQQAALMAQIQLHINHTADQARQAESDVTRTRQQIVDSGNTQALNQFDAMYARTRANMDAQNMNGMTRCQHIMNDATNYVWQQNQAAAANMSDAMHRSNQVFDIEAIRGDTAVYQCPRCQGYFDVYSYNGHHCS